MKSTLIACTLALSLFLFNCSSIAQKKESPKAPKNIVTLAPSDWHSYSLGHYYKNIKQYATAIQYFQKAAEKGIAPDLTAYQIAECHFYLNDFKTAISFARASVRHNNASMHPFILMFNAYNNLKNYRAAAVALEQLLLRKPRSIDIHFRLGIQYYTKIRDYDKALVYFNRILEMARTMPVEDYFKEYVNYYIANIYYMRKEYTKSIFHLRKVLAVNAENNSALYFLCILLMETFNIQEAEGYIIEYLRKFPDSVKMNTLLGQIYYIYSDSRSQMHLKRASGSNSIDGFISRALHLELTGQDEAALRHLNFIISKNPNIITVHLGLARVAFRMNQKQLAAREYFTTGLFLYNFKVYPIAKDCFIKVLAINSAFAEAYYYLARVYEDMGNITLAIPNYKKTYDLTKKSDLLIHIGYLHSQKKEFKKSIEYFDRAIRLNPKNSRPYFIKGLVYSHQQKYGTAEKLIKRAIAMEKNDTYYFYLATIQDKLDKFDDAVSSLKKSLRYNTKNARAYNYLGYLYADKNKNIDESIDLIKKALFIDPNNGAYLDSLGWAYYRKGDFKTALGHLLESEKQLDSLKTPDAVVYEHIGDTYNQMGETVKAIIYWKKSLRIEKNKKIAKKIASREALLKKRKAMDE